METANCRGVKKRSGRARGSIGDGTNRLKSLISLLLATLAAHIRRRGPAVSSGTVKDQVNLHESTSLLVGLYHPHVIGRDRKREARRLIGRSHFAERERERAKGENRGRLAAALVDSGEEVVGEAKNGSPTTRGKFG